MLKILTAIGNNLLNRRLSENSKFTVLGEDLNKKEDIINWFEKEENIDVLIISSKVLKDYDKKEFFEKLREIQKNIQIIIFDFLDDLKELEDEEYLKVYRNFEINLNSLENELLEKFYSIEEEKKNRNVKVIAVTGCSGIGKSTFSSFFSQTIQKENKKVLLIDFDLEENNIKTIFKIKKFPKSFEKIEENPIRINKNLDILCDLKLHFDNCENVNFLTVKRLLEKFENIYDVIIIDTSSKIEKQYIKNIFYNSNEIYFLVEPNILGIKKAQNMLEIFNKDWEIKSSKIKIILNKANFYQISDDIIQEIFSKNQLIGKIKYNDYYNLMINKNLYKKDIKKEYQKLIKCI